MNCELIEVILLLQFESGRVHIVVLKGDIYLDETLDLTPVYGFLIGRVKNPLEGIYEFLTLSSNI